MAELHLPDPDVTTSNATFTAAKAIEVPPGHSGGGTVQVVAHSEDGDYASWTLRFAFTRSGSAVSILDLGVLAASKSLGAALYDARVVDGGDGTAVVEVKGAASKNVAWSANLVFGTAIPAAAP